ncbi:hypothetical protein BDAP_002382 [Binucleata daphniae]
MFKENKDNCLAIFDGCIEPYESINKVLVYNPNDEKVYKETDKIIGTTKMTNKYKICLAEVKNEINKYKNLVTATKDMLIGNNNLTKC